MEYIVKQKYTLQEVADMLFRISYELIGSNETKFIDFVVLVKKMKQNYIGQLTIRYGLRDEVQGLFFEHWELEVTKLMKPIETGDIDSVIIESMEKELTSQMSTINDMYHLNLDMITDEEREFILENHKLSTNLFAKAFIQQMGVLNGDTPPLSLLECDDEIETL